MQRGAASCAAGPPLPGTLCGSRCRGGSGGPRGPPSAGALGTGLSTCSWCPSPPTTSSALLRGVLLLRWAWVGCPLLCCRHSGLHAELGQLGAAGWARCCLAGGARTGVFRRRKAVGWPLYHWAGSAGAGRIRVGAGGCKERQEGQQDEHAAPGQDRLPSLMGQRDCGEATLSTRCQALPGPSPAAHGSLPLTGARTSAGVALPAVSAHGPEGAAPVRAF